MRCELPREDGDAPSEASVDDYDVEAKGPDGVVFFNNCKNREHERLFGVGAFYDLSVVGKQASEALGLEAGQQCVVATMAPDGRVSLTWYSFVRERRLPERGGSVDATFRVLFGDLQLAETVSKEDAAAHPRYGAFFNRLGHFKQQSTISASVSAAQRPTGPPADTPRVKQLREDLSDLLRSGPPKTPDTLKLVQRVVKAYERPGAITRYVKRARGTICQLCQRDGFLMRGGRRYCEVHHLSHRSTCPPPECLHPDYLVVLCATCHRRMHYANVGEPVREGQTWRVRVDDEDAVFSV